MLKIDFMITLLIFLSVMQIASGIAQLKLWLKIAKKILPEEYGNVPDIVMFKWWHKWFIGSVLIGVLALAIIFHH